MSVAAITPSTRHLTPVPPWPDMPDMPAGTPVDPTGTRLTFTVQISVTGTVPPSEAAKVLRDIQELAGQMSATSVTMTPGAAISSTVDSEQVAGGLWIEPASRTVVQHGRSVLLTRREFDLLLFLCEHPRRVFSRDQLLSHVWGYEWVGGSRTVDVHVRRLRIKLAQEQPVVRTVHGVGYRLDDDIEVRIGHLPQ